MGNILKPKEHKARGGDKHPDQVLQALGRLRDLTNRSNADVGEGIPQRIEGDELPHNRTTPTGEHQTEYSRPELVGSTPKPPLKQSWHQSHTC